MTPRQRAFASSSDDRWTRRLRRSRAVRAFLASPLFAACLLPFLPLLGWATYVLLSNH